MLARRRAELLLFGLFAGRKVVAEMCTSAAVVIARSAVGKTAVTGVQSELSRS